MSEDSKNQSAWLKLFAKYDIVNQVNKYNFFQISATQINECREARLMTKFDNSNQLPAIFLKEKIAILPLSRGSYTLGRFKIFHDFEQLPNQVLHYPFHNSFESLDFNNINSESAAISCAYVSKILEHFIGEALVPTISGRMSSNAFDFIVDTHHSKPLAMSVNKAQIEIDAGFESETSFVLIEAKNYISDDFIVRQLYYPFRRWNDVISKKIRNIYLTYSNGVFELREYQFTHIESYNSINLIKSERYSIYHLEINTDTILSLIKTTQCDSEPNDVPFPQADSFERVVNLCELLNAGDVLSKVEITESFGFDSRQTDYYLNACKYLGLAEINTINGQVSGFLTEKGKRIFNNDINIRRVDLIQTIISKHVFNQSLELYINTATLPKKDAIVEIMRKSNLNNINQDTTYERRASTVLGWINWVVSQIEE
jgi:hypothetical protein